MISVLRGAFLIPKRGDRMPIVECKLTDCSKHGTEVCNSSRVKIDSVGSVECYDPVLRSSIVHAPFKSNCYGNKTSKHQGVGK